MPVREAMATATNHVLRGLLVECGPPGTMGTPEREPDGARRAPASARTCDDCHRGLQEAIAMNRSRRPHAPGGSAMGGPPFLRPTGEAAHGVHRNRVP